MLQGSTHRLPRALLAVLAAVPLAMSLPANAQSVKLQFGGPLGTFTATPSGHAAPTARTSKTTVAKAHTTERRKSHVATARSELKSTVRNDAADQPAAKPVTAAIEPQKAETKIEADAPTAVASGEITNCRKFIATAGTTIEVPCTSSGQ